MPWTAPATGIVMCQIVVVSSERFESAHGYEQTLERLSVGVCFPPVSRHERREFPGHPEDRAGESAYRSKADARADARSAPEFDWRVSAFLALKIFRAGTLRRIRRAQPVTRFLSRKFFPGIRPAIFSGDGQNRRPKVSKNLGVECHGIGTLKPRGVPPVCPFDPRHVTVTRQDSPPSRCGRRWCAKQC